jgi:tRNA1(Val) A37 N6-methylase TrmN6
MPPERQDLTDDGILGGRLRMLQPRTGHRVGHDAVLLAASVPACGGQRAVDLGAGVGAAGLALAARVAALSVTLVDIDQDLVALAAENAERNGLADRVTAIAYDVAALGHVPPGHAPQPNSLPDAVDHVLMNPPFRDPARQQLSPDARRRLAHAGTDLGRWIATATRLLRPDGMLSLVFAADGIAEVLGALGDDFGAVAILPIYPKPERAAIRILVRAVKGSRAPTELSPGLVLNTADGRPSREAEAVLRDAAPLLF